MAHRLHGDERHVEQEGHDRDEGELTIAVDRPRRRHRIIGQHEREHGERADAGERRADPGLLEMLLAMRDAADEQAGTEQPAEDDHHRREHRVARQRRRAGIRGAHQRDDQPDLDDRHRDSEDERAERLADAVGDDLGHDGPPRAPSRSARDPAAPPASHRQRAAAASRAAARPRPNDSDVSASPVFGLSRRRRQRRAPALARLHPRPDRQMIARARCPLAVMDAAGDDAQIGREDDAIERRERPAAVKSCAPSARSGDHDRTRASSRHAATIR